MCCLTELSFEKVQHYHDWLMMTLERRHDLITVLLVMRLNMMMAKGKSLPQYTIDDFKKVSSKNQIAKTSLILLSNDPNQN